MCVLKTFTLACLSGLNESKKNLMFYMGKQFKNFVAAQINRNKV